MPSEDSLGTPARDGTNLLKYLLARGFLEGLAAVPVGSGVQRLSVSHGDTTVPAPHAHLFAQGAQQFPTEVRASAAESTQFFITPSLLMPYSQSAHK